MWCVKSPHPAASEGPLAWFSEVQDGIRASAPPAEPPPPADSLPAQARRGGSPAGPPSSAGPAAASLLRGLAQPAPRYPRAARLRGAEGITWLRVQVAATGRVARVEVERSAGDPELDRAAVDAVERWRFAAFREEVDEPGIWVRVPIEFRLR